jgi:hypothetical protein
MKPGAKKGIRCKSTGNLENSKNKGKGGEGLIMQIFNKGSDSASYVNKYSIPGLSIISS